MLRTLENQKEDPVKQCFKEVNKLVFNKHSYSMPMIGNEKTIKSHSRKKLIDLHTNSLENSPLVITYCGDKSFEYVKNIVDKKIINLFST